MKKQKYIKWFFLFSTALGSLASFTIYYSIKKINNKSIKIDYNKIDSFLNNQNFKKTLLSSNGKNDNEKFTQKFNETITDFKNHNYNLNDISLLTKNNLDKNSHDKKYLLNQKNNNNIFRNNYNISKKDKNILSDPHNFFGSYFGKNNLFDPKNSWDDFWDKTKFDWTLLCQVLTGLQVGLITLAVVAAAAATAYFAMAFFTFGGTVAEAIQCSELCAVVSAASITVTLALTAVQAALVFNDDDRYSQMKKFEIAFLSIITPLAVFITALSAQFIESSWACPAALVGVGAVSAVLGAVTKVSHDSDEGKNYFLFKGINYNKNDIANFSLNIMDAKNTILTIGDRQKHEFKENIDDANKDYAYLISIMPSKGQGEIFKFHDQSFDITKVSSFDVNIIDNKNTLLTINDGQKHEFKENLDDANKDYTYLSSIMSKQGQGENFNIHGQSFDINQITSFDVQVNDNKNTTLTINDDQKHQFKENIDDANKDYTYLNSIMSSKGQGEIFKFHDQSFDLTKINLFNVNVIDNKDATLTINDGQKHQFKENLDDANKDYAYLNSIMPKQGQGENFIFHGHSFDLTKISSFDVNVIDNKNTTLTINDGQKHEFKENINDANKDYAYLNSIMPSNAQGENFKFHGQSFDLTKVSSFDVKIDDNKNTILTINDGQKHEFKKNLDDANKDYAYLNSIMPSKGQGEIFKFHDQSFDITKVSSFDVNVIDNKNTTLTINDGQKHEFKENIDDVNKDYAYLNSIMPNKGQGENFIFHGQSFDITKISSFDVNVVDNKNTTLTINDGQKHEFKENINDANKDYAYLNSIMSKQGQGENFEFHGQSFDLTKVSSFDVKIDDNKNTTLTINDGQKHQFKENLDDANKDYAYLVSIMPKQGQGENFNIHSQSFDLTKINSFDVNVIDNKNTTLTINDGQKHQFKENIDDANKDYAYLESIMPSKGQGENFIFHGQSFDLTKINSFDVKIDDNKNTTLTINDGQKHQFKENLDDVNKDYAYLNSIMPNKGQGENFIFHGQSFDLTKISSFDVKIDDNKNTTLTINDGQKHRFNENLNDANKDYAYLNSIMPSKGQGENFIFHGQSFDLTKISLFGVQVIDNKDATLTINDGQKHQFKENIDDANKDYAYLNSIMPNKGQGENFNIHGQSFDLTKVSSFDVKIDDNKNTILTINDGQKHEFKENLNDANKDYAYLESIMPKQEQGENFNIHGQKFDLTKVSSFSIKVITDSEVIVTIHTNDNKDHSYTEKLKNAKTDYIYLQSIMPNQGQGIDYHVWNDIKISTITISSLILITLIIVGIELYRRKIINRKYTNAKKPSFEFRNPKLKNNILK